MSALPRAVEAAGRAVRLCALADLPEGRARGFDPEDAGFDTIFIIRRGAALHGWRNACPHYANGARMNWKKDAFLNADGSRIMCSAHGALFDIETGICEIGPCLGKRLTPVPLILQGDEVHFGPVAPRE